MLYNQSPTKIMVVSYDSLMLDFLRTVLDLQKFVVKTTSPTSDGISSIRQFSPHLVVVDDLNTPTDILNACQNIRQYSMMPILVLSAQRKAGFVEQVLDAGADEYLLKPVPGSVLVAHLKTLARRAYAEKEAALSIVRDENEPRGQLGLLAY
jgi:DNA-binding response OmpR family regulator